MWKKLFGRDQSTEDHVIIRSSPENDTQHKLEPSTSLSHTNPSGENIMTNDLITPENLSKELLKSIYDSAFMKTSWDDDDDLRVTDQISCFVLPTEKNDRIQLLTLFGFKQNSSESQRLNCVNNINREYIIVVAVASANNILQFKHEIYVEGGITKKNLILTTKRFLSIPMLAVQEHGGNIVT
jgi:hypothetical protein